MTETEKYVTEAMAQYKRGIDGDAVYHPLYKAWRSFQNDVSQLGKIQDCSQFGMGLMFFLSYGTVRNIDEQQQLASIAYYFISKSIKENPNNINNYKNRLLIMLLNQEAFQYTVSSVVNEDAGFDFMGMQMGSFNARDAMFKMEFADLHTNQSLLSIEMLRNRYNDLRNKISSGFFGNSETYQTIQQSGMKYHNDVFSYIEEKVITEQDVDF
ncbi:MAG: hypothetical protein IKO99_06105 [Bacteroidales bacterium]|nr:hypothetical protein [Bacteroidales bacterium]